MKFGVMISVFIMVICASLYAMEEDNSQLLSEQSATMNNYGSLAGNMLDGIHEQKKYVLMTMEEEQHEFVFNDLGKRIEAGIKCGGVLCGGMILSESILGLCLGYGISFVCLPNVLLSTAVVSGGTCLCTSFFCSEKQPCDVCCS